MALFHEGQDHCTVYAHLQEDSNNFEINDTAERFDVIASSGDTGESSGPHLHFGVYGNMSGCGSLPPSNQIDPYGWEASGQDPWPGTQGYLWTTDPPSFDWGDNYNIINVTEDITEDTIWEYGNIYVVYGRRKINPGVTLTIEPGVIIKFEVTSQYNSSSLDVYGDLLVQGTEQNKIYFTSLRDDSIGGDTNNDATSTVPAPRDFTGINIYTTNPINISNAVLRYGGDCQGQFTCAARGVITGLVLDARVTIASSTIEHNDYGIYFPVSSGTSTISISNSLMDDNGSLVLKTSSPIIILSVHNTTISNSGTGLYLDNNSINTFKSYTVSLTNTKFQNNIVDSSFTYYNSGGGEIDFVNDENSTSGSSGGGFYLSGNLKGNQIWNSGVPFVIYDLTIPSNGSLSINPGVIVKLQDHWSYALNVNGNLSASGTPSQKIYFTSYKDDSVAGDTNRDATSTAPAPEDFIGIKVNNSGYANISNTVIRYGGACEGQHSCQLRGGISVLGGGMNVENSVITKNNYGIYRDSGVVDISNSSVKNNNNYGIYHTGTGSSTNAINNWWGHVSGPYHSTQNPNGQGNAVSSGVDFTPWKTKPPVGSGGI